MSVVIYYSYPLFLILECMSPVGSVGIPRILPSMDPLDHTGSMSRDLCVAVLVWLTSIPRPRLYWSNPVE